MTRPSDLSLVAHRLTRKARGVPVGQVSCVVRRLAILGLCRRAALPSELERLTSVLSNEPASSPAEVGLRCQAAEALAALGPAASSAVPALLQTLVVPITVDCALALRVAAAAAVWKVGHRCDVAIPFLAWALKDEYWGVAPRAVAVLSEIGHAAVVLDLVRLAERCLEHGPFHFETFSEAAGEQDSEPLLAAVADAIGRCARGRGEGRSYLGEARATLLKLAAFEDGRVRAAASEALSGLEDTT